MFSFLTVKGWTYTDIYDLEGNLIFDGDPLYEFWSYKSPEGGYEGQYYKVYGHWDRFLRDFGSQLTLYEWINNSEYELKLGRFSTSFTPLTLQKERFRWGYPGGYYYSEEWAWGRWWDQRTARLRVTKGKNEWMALIAKTADVGDDDDSWWTGDIDKDRYFVAFRRKTSIFGLNLGFSFVNQHFTNFKTGDTAQHNFFSSQGPLSGVIDDNPPSEIYLKFTDDSPYDEAGSGDYAGAAVYKIKVFIDGVKEPTLYVGNGIPAGSNVSWWGTFTIIYGKRVEASGPNDRIIYKFTLPGDVSSIESVRFVISAANDYKIEVSRDDGAYDPYRTIFRAEGNIKDYSNRKELIYNYGNNTGDTILGFDISGILPGINVSFQAEIAGSKKFFKYPTAAGKRDDNIGKAWYLKMSKEIYPVLLTGEVFDFDYNYDASFAVEDNDDRDDKPDIVDDYVAWYEEYPGTRRDDDFVLFKVDRAFREGIDLNNNKAFDNEENDIKPDYPYREGQEGYIISSAYRALPNLKLQTQYINSKEKMSDRRNETLFGKIKYNFNPVPVGIKLRHEIKRTKDNIQDSLVYDPDDPNPWADQRYENWTDPLTFRDNLINQTYITLNFKVIPNLTLINRYLYGIDHRYYSEETRNFMDGILRVSYDNWFPLKKFSAFKNWQFIPMYKLERWNEQSSKKDYKWLVGDWRKDAFALVLLNRLTEKTRLFIGEQIVYYDDLYQDHDSARYVFAIEVVHDDQYWDRPLMVLAGVKFVRQVANFESDSERYEHYYIKAFFRW